MTGTLAPLPQLCDYTLTVMGCLYVNMNMYKNYFQSWHKKNYFVSVLWLFLTFRGMDA